jgi:predicted metal-dependent enzyme (double-stranded beta helix superfamily)
MTMTAARPTTTTALPTTTLSPPRLLALLENYAARLSYVAPPHDPTQRGYSLLELSEDLEIWAIHWPTDQGLELHDHGGSTGALVVIEGCLYEHVPAGAGTLRQRRLESGEGVAFGPTYVHDVVNRCEAPAISLHAYSPPMATMTFYRTEGRQLVADRTEYRSDPTWNP